MIDNIEYSKEWLYQKYIESYFNEKKDKKKYVKLTESDLYNLVYKFVCINEEQISEQESII